MCSLLVSDLLSYCFCRELVPGLERSHFSWTLDRFFEGFSLRFGRGLMWTFETFHLPRQEVMSWLWAQVYDGENIKTCGIMTNQWRLQLYINVTSGSNTEWECLQKTPPQKDFTFGLVQNFWIWNSESKVILMCVELDSDPSISGFNFNTEVWMIQFESKLWWV